MGENDMKGIEYKFHTSITPKNLPQNKTKYDIPPALQPAPLLQTHLSERRVSYKMGQTQYI